MKALSRIAAASMLITALASCSIGFDHRWRKAAAESKGAPLTDLTGAWEGTWKSESTGHEGTLRAIAKPQAPTPGSTADAQGRVLRYDFEYEATWKKFLSAVFRAEHQARWKKDGCVLTGQKDLGRFGGIFRFTGEATPTEFHAKYESKSESGVFEMKRP